MVYNFFDKKSTGSGIKSMWNQQFSDELDKPIIRKCKRRTIYSSFNDNIRGADLADMQLISKCNKGIRYLLYVFDIFITYAWVVPLKDKKGITIFNVFQSILESSKTKAIKIWIDQGSDVFNKQWKRICCCWKIY